MLRHERTARLSARIADRLGLRPDDAMRVQVARLADAYVKMTAARSGDDALWALWRQAGEHYPTDLVDVLIEVSGSRPPRFAR